MNTDLALFILRIFAGIVLIAHGWPKIKDIPGLMRWLHKEKFPLIFISAIGLVVAEFIAAIMFILGIFVQYIAWVTAFAMLVATIYNIKNVSWKEAEKPLLLFAISVALGIAGAGAWALI